MFCRLRPDEEEKALIVVNPSTVQLVPPVSSKAYAGGKELQCSFKRKLACKVTSYLTVVQMCSMRLRASPVCLSGWGCRWWRT